DGFKPHEQTFASASSDEFQQFQIVRQQNGCKAVPLHTQRNKRREQTQGVIAVCDKIEVYEDQFAGSVLANVGNHLFNRLLIRLPSPRGRHDAEITVVDTAPSRLEHIVGQVAIAWKQIAASERPVCKIEIRRLIVSGMKLAI